jgi:hypothetical protein
MIDADFERWGGGLDVIESSLRFEELGWGKSHGL